MMIPRKGNFDIFDNFFEDPFFEGGRNRNHNSMMQTDIREKDGKYILEVDVPGFNKEDIKIELENGYLTIEANTNKSVDKSNEKEHYIHKERYYGKCSRSFYVGDEVEEKDVKASFKNGILTLVVPKKDAKKIENKRYIEIEGE